MEDIKIKKMEINDSHKKIIEANVSTHNKLFCSKLISGKIEAAAGIVWIVQEWS